MHNKSFSNTWANYLMQHTPIRMDKSSVELSIRLEWGTCILTPKQQSPCNKRKETSSC